MKNLLKNSIVILFLFIGMNMNAQNEKISFGIKAGLNLSNFGGDVEDMDAKIGFNAGVTLDYAITGNLFLLTGLDFTTKGCKYSEDDYKETVNSMFLQLPIHAAYKFEITDQSRLVVNAGPYIAYGIGGKVKYEEDGESEKFDFFGSEEDGGMKRFDFGLGLGVGFEYDKFKVGIGYDFGLANIGRDDVDVKTRNGYLTVGYRF